MGLQLHIALTPLPVKIIPSCLLKSLGFPDSVRLYFYRRELFLQSPETDRMTIGKIEIANSRYLFIDRPFKRSSLPLNDATRRDLIH